MSLQAVIIKAYLELPGSDRPEIRRFSIDRCATFANLNRKLEKAFPSLDDFQSRSVEFLLFWKDSEGDEISLSTNAELSEAMECVTDNILKIYIKVKSTASSNSNNENQENVHHPNVTCDGCQSEIYGIRYKCMICFDYDLCKNCEAKGTHNEHPFARIKTPGTFPSFEPPPPPPFHFGMFGRKGGGKWFGNWHGRCQQGGRWGRHHHNQESKSNMPFAQNMQSTGDNTQDYQEFLKNVGENIKDYLDPFGINVKVDVEHGNERQCAGCNMPRNTDANPNPASTSNSTTDATKTPAFVPSAPAFVPSAPSTTTPSATAIPLPAAPVISTPAAPVISLPAAPVISPSTAPIVSTAATNLTATPKITPDGLDHEMPDSATSAGPSTEEMDCDWTYVIHKETEADGSGAKKLTFELKQSKTGNDLNNSNSFTPDKAAEVLAATSINEKPDFPIRHPNPKINSALYIMEEMGFNDDGGWLTILLEAKNGDITKVLDALQPAK